VALVYMLVCAVAMPFKDKGDDFFANACSFALVAVFFFCIVMKISVLTEEVRVRARVRLRLRLRLSAHRGGRLCPLGP
jgi:hypothetical protein